MSKFKHYAALEKMVSQFPIDPSEKVFDPEGTFRLRFAESDVRGFEEWVEEAGWPPYVAIEYATIEDDEVFGRAFEFPCRVV